MTDKESDLSIVPHDKQVPEVQDYLETQESIPAPLLKDYENLSEEDQKKFAYHLDNLKSKSQEYSGLNGNSDERIACIKEIASIAKAFVSDFIHISYEEVLQYSSSFVNRIQQNEFLELVLREWLQLYIDAENTRQEQEKVEDTKKGILHGVSKVIVTGIRNPANFIKGNS